MRKATFCSSSRSIFLINISNNNFTAKSRKKCTKIIFYALSCLRSILNQNLVIAKKKPGTPKTADANSWESPEARKMREKIKKKNLLGNRLGIGQGSLEEEGVKEAISDVHQWILVVIPGPVVVVVDQWDTRNGIILRIDSRRQNIWFSHCLCFPALVTSWSTKVPPSASSILRRKMYWETCRLFLPR